MHTAAISVILRNIALSCKDGRDQKHVYNIYVYSVLKWPLLHPLPVCVLQAIIYVVTVQIKMHSTLLSQSPFNTHIRVQVLQLEESR